MKWLSGMQVDASKKEEKSTKLEYNLSHVHSITAIALCSAALYFVSSVCPSKIAALMLPQKNNTNSQQPGASFLLFFCFYSPSIQPKYSFGAFKKIKKSNE